MKIVFATNNLNKLSEIKSLVPNSIEILSLNDISCNEELPETNPTIEENAIQKALLINPKYAPAFNNRGVLNHNYKRYDDAITDFDKAIVLNRDYAKAYLNRGITKQMIRDENGACLDWIKARDLGIMMAKTYLANDCE